MLTQNDQDRLVARGRDEMMTAFCKVANPNEAQQRDASERFIGFMQDLIPQIVGVVAVGDYPAVAVKLENVDGKGKIQCKALNVDEAGPALITHVGASMTLVLTAAEQFDRQRPAANIDPDQRSLLPNNDDGDGEGDDDEEQQEEAGEDDQTDLSTNLADLFSTVEATPGCWTVLHGGVEIFSPLAAEEFANDVRGYLTDMAKEVGRDLTPFEVRDRVQVVLQVEIHNDLGIAFAAPYTPEGISAAASAPVEQPASKAGRKSTAEIVETYHAGYDAAEAGQSISDCPHARGKLKDTWQRGWADQKDGKPRGWERPTPAPANDDVATETEAA